MFQELLPLLKKRTLVITVAEEGDQMRVNIVPKSLDGDKGEDLKQGQSTPLSVLATAPELDAQLPVLLERFVSKHLSLDESLAQFEKDIDEAKKQASGKATEKVEAAKKAATRSVRSAAAPSKAPSVPPAPAPVVAKQPGLFPDEGTKTVAATA
jgi:PRTRC genetic system protein E